MSRATPDFTVPAATMAKWLAEADAEAQCDFFLEFARHVGTWDHLPAQQWASLCTALELSSAPSLVARLQVLGEYLQSLKTL